MADKQIIIDNVDVSECPAMDTYNIFGIEDKPCCYKFHEYCSAIPNCYYKQLKRKEQECEGLEEELNDLTRDIKTHLKVEKIKLDQLKAENEKLEQTLAEIKEICNEYQKEYILNIGVEILTNKILQII